MESLPQLELLDWKRRIFDLYRDIQASGDPHRAWETWRETRDELFRTHSQSPIPEHERTDFAGVPYFDYDPVARVLGRVEHADPESFDIPTSGDETMRFSRFAAVAFELYGNMQTLELYWLDAYGGGVFLPFRDATAGTETYGAGRYLLDTVKGADLGGTDGELILDFNFAYNPSCSYDPRWVCPLAPPPNRLHVEVRAGEKSS